MRSQFLFYQELVLLAVTRFCGSSQGARGSLGAEPCVAMMVQQHARATRGRGGHCTPKGAQAPSGHAHPDEPGHPRLTITAWMCLVARSTKRKGKSKVLRLNLTWEDGNRYRNPGSEYSSVPLLPYQQLWQNWGYMQ